MIVGQTTTEKSIKAQGFKQTNDLLNWLVFENSTTILYWNKTTKVIERMITYNR